MRPVNLNRKMLTKTIGLSGMLICVALFVVRPSFPTPDKLFIFLLLLFMAFGQAWELFKRLFPFVAVILVYESFRSVADHLNTHVDYLLSPHADRLLFGNLPTVYLQNWLWQGRAVVSTYLVVAFGAFLTFFIFPSAPPWLASQNHYIEPITRISSQVWAGLGLQDFPSFYDHISPNPVAAVPSLHAAWAALLFIFTLKLYGRRWAALAAIYPLLIFIGTIYEGEHYAFDVIAGIVYAIVGYLVTPVIMRYSKLLWNHTVPIFSTSRPKRS
jgi:membrane-associated phospholipid phosphatase